MPNIRWPDLLSGAPRDPPGLESPGSPTCVHDQGRLLSGRSVVIEFWMVGEDQRPALSQRLERVDHDVPTSRFDLRTE